jgi:hypothetical protein
LFKKVYKRVYVDAKFRDYKQQGEQKWKKDIIEIAVNKYLLRTTGNDRGDISFIVHSDQNKGQESEEKGIAYNGLYDRDLRGDLPFQIWGSDELREKYAHSFGSFCMIPENVGSFKKWFRMLMEYHFNLFYVCWSCGSMNQVVEEENIRGVGKHFRCLNCNDFWVKSHCENKKHDLIKHLDNYHKQVEENNPWNVVCPVCFGRL